ncbi:hypothetical protein KAR91_27130 [Candidatus Pacearchaeota archaeon]|nr:hypothetical protein [Candidatus Pacearchaeota archaeon]
MSRDAIKSIIISFGSLSSVDAGIIVLEPDDLLNIDSEGNPKTTFNPGDDFYFLVHHDHTILIDSVKSTSGALRAQGEKTRTNEQLITFTLKTEEHALRHRPQGAISATYYGNEVSGLAVNNRKLTASGGRFPADGLVSYSYRALSYKLTSPTPNLGENDTWPIHAVAYYRDVT